MPELPEVETIARHLDSCLAGKTFARPKLMRSDIVHGDPRPLSRLLTGRRVVRVRRRAKRVIIELVPDWELIFHLGMSGRLTVCAAKDPIEKHTHLRIRIEDEDLELRFCDPRRFGGVWCLTGSEKHKGRKLGSLGPEPLEITPRSFADLIQQRKRQIKALLLDQHIIAGLGNIYCDEALHQAGIHPLRLASTLTSTETRLLHRAIQKTLRKAIRYGGSTLRDYRKADGREGSFQKRHRVYQRHGKPCKQCGTKIIRLSVAGRSTFVCDKCQPCGIKMSRKVRQSQK